MQIAWDTPPGKLALDAATWVSDINGLDRVFRDKLESELVPLVRLSDEMLAR